MPELPEVETIARSLHPELVGKIILDADVRWARTIAMPSVRKFKERIRGQRIESVSRRAKFLHLTLSKDSLFVHLRMSGDLLIKEETAAPEKHDRLILTIASSPIPVEEGQGALKRKKLVFNDARKFGRVWLTDQPARVVGDLGPEPLDDRFTTDMFYEMLHHRHRRLKPLLLDQTFLAGLGNIYTDEALHTAKLHPLAASNAVKREQARVLYEAIRAVLTEGIRRNGASIDWVYRGGEFQNHFRVYGREGQPCPVCGTKIKRLVVGQRGTHICPRCQPLRRSV